MIYVNSANVFSYTEVAIMGRFVCFVVSHRREVSLW